jgi:alkylated DNA nucleotide flippase Atl1
MATEKSRETRLRRAADRRGYQLVKSSRRDPQATDYGAYLIIDTASHTVIAGDDESGRASMTLDEVEAWLAAPQPAAAPARGEKVIRVMRAIRKGEWTTYSDVSQAAYGHPKGRRAVGRVLIGNTWATIPNAQRVLNQWGKIPPRWKSGMGGGPEDCAKRLRADGVEILTGDSGDMYAHPRNYMGAEELAKRVAVKTPAA